DWRALAFLLAATVASGLISGLLPAFRSAHADAALALRAAARNATGGPALRRTRDLLAAAEIAIAMVLLAGAGLMVKGFAGLVQKEQGMAPRSVLTMRLNLSPARYAKAGDVRAF